MWPNSNTIFDCCSSGSLEEFKIEVIPLLFTKYFSKNLDYWGTCLTNTREQTIL